MDLSKSTALVTGGAVRIGRAIVEALAARGCRVLIHYRRSRGEAEALAARLRKAGARALALAGRLDSDSACAALMDRAIQAAPELNILINNASLFNKESLRTMTPESLRRELQVNLLAPIVLTQALARHLVSADARGSRASRTSAAGLRGSVVNLVDRRVAGQEAGCVPYLVSKKALWDFTRIAALDLAPEMAVNAVAPGAVLPPPGKGPAAIRDLAGRAPLRHRCVPADVARAVIFLLENESMTGQALFVDSGQHLLGGEA